MAPADEEPARPPHDDVAPASVPPAPSIAAESSAPARAAAAACSSSAPSSPPPASSASPTTRSVITAPAAAAADDVSSSASDRAPPTPRMPTTPPPTDDCPSTAAVVALASKLQQSGGDDDDNDAAGSDPGADNMSTHSAALSAAHHGVSLSYPSSTTASPPVYLPFSNVPSGQNVPYPTPSQSVDAYRASPIGSSTPMALPSMRTMDAMPQQLASQPPPNPHHAMAMGFASALGPVSSSPVFYPHHAMALPSNYGLAHDGMSRLGSRASKKEIKRRTKTGCLTCRKRRIKCDETHPTCNNCKKSKRECLGYDPIFRPQAGSGPAHSHIQPAPAAQPSASSAPPAPTPTSALHLANSYGNQPAVLPSTYTPAPTVLASTTDSTASYSPPNPVKTEPSHDPFIKPEPGDSAPRHWPALPGDCSKPPASLADGNPPFRASKRMKIHEIIDLLGPPSPPQQVSHTEDTFNEIIMVYHEMYANGLGAFFETTYYYFTEGGKMTFPKDTSLIEHMESFLKILEAVKANDHTQMAYSGALETRIVWELACVAYRAPDRTNSGARAALPSDGDGVEARNRLRVVEALLCGEYLAANPLAPPIMVEDQHRMRQFDFWYSLAEFVRHRNNPGSSEATKAREDMLARMRHLLDGRENRDVLYSIAVMRELAPQFEPGYAGTIPQHLDETDPKNRLAVASKFILDEAQVTGGTTNVVRRFSDIAWRAFVNPGVNVTRNS